jgi:hypothetical protein
MIGFDVDCMYLDGGSKNAQSSLTGNGLVEERGVFRTGPFTIFGIRGVKSEGCNGYCTRRSGTVEGA